MKPSCIFLCLLYFVTTGASSQKLKVYGENLFSSNKPPGYLWKPAEFISVKDCCPEDDKFGDNCKYCPFKSDHSIHSYCFKMADKKSLKKNCGGKFAKLKCATIQQHYGCKKHEESGCQFKHKMPRKERFQEENENERFQEENEEEYECCVKYTCVHHDSPSKNKGKMKKNGKKGKTPKNEKKDKGK